ncbi:MAG: hypothetical protein NVS2B1_02760 [Bradyrhizobium sp.]
MQRSITKNAIVSITFLVLVGEPAAIAQTGGGAGSSAGSSATAPASADNRTSGGAPVGRRQPRLSDVPSEKNLSSANDPANKEDAALDRKIKSICRGC